MIRMCIVGTCFQFEDNFYKQIFGLQMGAKLSPIVANLALEIFETESAADIIQRSIFWMRYMDDILSVWKEDEDLEAVLKELNTRHNSLKFTLEEEEENQLSFLDLSIIRCDSCLEFKIFRKPSNNLLTINYFSSHEPQIKLSGIISMYLRALKFVSPKYMEEEFKMIESIVKINDCPDHIVNLARDKANIIFHKTLPRTIYNPTMTLCLPFAPCLSKLSGPLHLMGIKLVFKYNNTLLDRLCRNSPCSYEANIYAIKCNCNKFYIGQTTLEVTKRVSQHYSYVIKNVHNSACNQHYRECNMGIIWNQPLTISHINDYFSRNMFETLLIKYTWENNFNLSVGPVASDKLLLHIASVDYKFGELLDKHGLSQTRSNT
ncbi:unnamed protein product [Rotaria socialis]|uniref:Reverse transcriptase domain-containing protein n=2 Tax=Rotaria socialis TaxID=392032 RepID=A0A821WJ64_9BILA|nr:unnamed protein product [Rotaria socialis]